MPRFIGYPRSAITRHYRFSVLEISCSNCTGFRLGFFLFLSKAQFRVSLVMRAPNVAVKPYRSTLSPRMQSVHYTPVTTSCLRRSLNVPSLYKFLRKDLLQLTFLHYLHIYASWIPPYWSRWEHSDLHSCRNPHCITHSEVFGVGISHKWEAAKTVPICGTPPKYRTLSEFRMPCMN